MLILKSDVASCKGLHKYFDGFNREKDPIVMFMGHIGVPTKKLVKGNECFIFYFCVLCSATYRKIFCFGRVQVFFFGGGGMLSDNSFSCFRRKAFYKSDMLARFTTSVALIEYLACVF